jgi:hypothetical protein
LKGTNLHVQDFVSTSPKGLTFSSRSRNSLEEKLGGGVRSLQAAKALLGCPWSAQLYSYINS